MLESKPTQCEQIKDYVRKHGSIDFFVAIYKLGISQIAARITEIESKGEMRFNHIRKTKKINGNTIKYVEYQLEGENG